MAEKDLEKLRRQLRQMANDAASASGRKANRILIRMAGKAGLNVKSGGKHFNVTHPQSGRSVTRIPRSPRAKPTIEAIARAILDSVEEAEDSE